MRKIPIYFFITCIVLLLSSETKAKNEEFLITRQHIKIENRVSFLEKTSKEWNTDEGKAFAAVVGSIAAVYGVDPKYITAATYANKLYQDNKRTEGNQYYFEMRAPKGYTICWARPTNYKGQYRGVESSHSSTSSTIYRPKRGGGELWLYADVPHRRSVTTRVMFSFDVVFLRTDLWRSGGSYSKKCQSNKYHPWISKHNNTRLNVKPEKPRKAPKNGDGDRGTWAIGPGRMREVF